MVGWSARIGTDQPIIGLSNGRLVFLCTTCAFFSVFLVDFILEAVIMVHPCSGYFNVTWRWKFTAFICMFDFGGKVLL
jgi:hypothetical protein